jgi:hypothetical protein
VNYVSKIVTRDGFLQTFSRLGLFYTLLNSFQRFRPFLVGVSCHIFS